MKSMKKESAELSSAVIGSAIEVHTMLGHGLPESTYQQRLARELDPRGISFKLEHPLPVAYKGLSTGLRMPY